MSRDSSRTYIHMHSPHHADLFEDFTRPANLKPSNQDANQPHPHTSGPTNIPWSTLTSAPTLLASHPLGNHSHFPPEDILIPLHLLPPNPDDDEDIVPDQHAAFGISKALNGREGVHADRWTDFGSLSERVRGVELREREVNGVGGGAGQTGTQGRSAAARAREGR